MIEIKSFRSYKRHEFLLRHGQEVPKPSTADRHCSLSGAGGGSAVPNVPGAAAAILGGAGLYAAVSSLYNGEGGHRAIGFNRIYGIKDKVRWSFVVQVYPEGTHLMVPWLERPIIYDVRAWPQLVESSTSGNRDLQMVKIGLRVLTWPFANCLPTIYLSLTENYNETVLPSIIHETLKSVVAQYNASQLITQREVYLIYVNRYVDDTEGTEAKQVAAQEAEQAKFIVEKAEQDKKCAIIRAQDARLIGQAIAMNPAFLALRRIEAATEVAQKIANSANRAMQKQTFVEKGAPVPEPITSSVETTAKQGSTTSLSAGRRNGTQDKAKEKVRRDHERRRVKRRNAAEGFRLEERSE
ncbi:hypothetical protein C4D60_Mb06t13350 [Musa balbisiana]|uniref:Band 7 domain-containing protein n=1 Tax=Musa balbisiana TaxID=52838 RepID=A0A4S8IMX0_MUSBA|nr:hypothetical protein C4D60_Mb06t13350 [Musa balbisiana]